MANFGAGIGQAYENLFRCAGCLLGVCIVLSLALAGAIIWIIGRHS